jgi:hypothetical protein
MIQMQNLSKPYHNTLRSFIEYLAVLVLLLSITIGSQAQNTSYGQVCNELQFGRAINDKWAGEVYLGGTFSNTPTDPKLLSTNIQRYAMLWGHYYFSPRWKLSSSLAYFYNKDVPDIGQYFSPEYRLSLQGIYFFHKIGYILSTRIRGEFRLIMNEAGVYEDKYRYRQMIKYVKPLNSQVLRQGVFYCLATEELLLKPQAKEKGVNFFDRNRLEIGGGYLFTDDLQLELAYLNEFVPRDNGNQIYNAIEMTLTFTNPFPNLKKHLSSLTKSNNMDD